MVSKMYEALTSAIYVARLTAQGTPLTEDDQRIRASGLYAPWEEGNFAAGEIRNAQGQTWECHQAHDCAIYGDIYPGSQAWPAFWRPLHGSTPETARPWVQPQYGTTDSYRTGECMVYVNGRTYRARRDTCYSPEAYAMDWEEIED